MKLIAELEQVLQHGYTSRAEHLIYLMSPGNKPARAANGGGYLCIVGGIANEKRLGGVNTALSQIILGQLYLTDGVNVLQAQHLVKHAVKLGILLHLRPKLILLGGRNNHLAKPCPMKAA